MNENSEIQKQIIKNITKGDYSENLAFAMKNSAAAVVGSDLIIENYFILQSIAQSLIALNLQVENFVDHVAEKENWYGHG